MGVCKGIETFVINSGLEPVLPTPIGWRHRSRCGPTIGQLGASWSRWFRIGPSEPTVGLRAGRGSQVVHLHVVGPTGD